MAFKLQMVDDLVHIGLHGQLTDVDLKQIFDEAELIESAAKVVPHRLTDMSCVQRVNLNFFAVERHAARRRAAPLRNRVKSAIVAPELFQYGFARMFQTLNDNPQIHLRLFRDLASADRWIHSASPA